MNRRDFLFSISLLAGVSVIERAGSFLGHYEGVAHAMPIKIEYSPIPMKSCGIREARRDGRTIITNACNSSIILNEAGAMAWNRIDGKTTRYEIAVLLSHEFGTNFKQSLRDVQAFTSSLAGEEFITMTEMGRCRAIERVVYRRKTLW
jgi:hypothetical protein